MTSDDLSTGAAPIHQRPRDEQREPKNTRVRELEPLAPDAVSPEERSDGDGPLRGTLDADSGAGAAGGHDRGGPGGRSPDEPGEAGRGVHSNPAGDARD